MTLPGFISEDSFSFLSQKHYRGARYVHVPTYDHIYPQQLSYGPDAPGRPGSYRECVDNCMKRETSSCLEQFPYYYMDESDHQGWVACSDFNTIYPKCRQTCRSPGVPGPSTPGGRPPPTGGYPRPQRGGARRNPEGPSWLYY